MTFEKRSWTEADQQLLLNLLLGGSLVGGGVGAATSALNHLNSINDDNQALDKHEKGILRVRIPGTKAANETVPAQGPGDLTPWSWALAAPAAIGGGLLANRAVKKIYEMMRQQELKRELENTQEAYYNAVDQEAALAKRANEEFARQTPRAKDMFGMAALTALGVPALSTALLTHLMLNKAFPADKALSERKSLVLADPSGEEEIKQASDVWGPDFRYGGEALEAATPFLAEVVLSHLKQASKPSWLPDLVHEAALGGIRRIEDAVSTAGGWDGGRVAGLFKGASAQPISPVQRSAGIAMLMKSATVGPTFRALLAAEGFDISPIFAKVAAALDQDTQIWLLKWAALHTRATFLSRLEKDAGRDVTSDKEAGEYLKTALSKEQQESVRNLSGGGGVSTDSDVVDDQKRVETPASDGIDKALTGVV